MPGETQTSLASRFLNVREVVKLDIALHGKAFMLLEFGLCALFFWPLAFTVLYFDFFFGKRGVIVTLTTIAGCFLLVLGMSALTIFLLTLDILRKGEDTNRTLFRPSQYRKVMQQFALLMCLPLVLPLLAIYQALAQQNAIPPSA